jgi:hypothetical protein
MAVVVDIVTQMRGRGLKKGQKVRGETALADRSSKTQPPSFSTFNNNLSLSRARD